MTQRFLYISSEPADRGIAVGFTRQMLLNIRNALSPNGSSPCRCDARKRMA
ncbi:MULTISPECIES: hypothetical protein [Mediterranea]|uniref:hypothetical protein n=1 Tax=Mediterranea TaxID=1926659 RepID=UPI000AC1C9BC|nr:MULTISPECIES: hypothetical protein [Mediterranea]MCL1607231.1 hypothetical protein [Mediterranea sp. ET5]MDM8121631.1 hypothetical protein [Mediterranea massiliensis]MDM8199137.1 hypothetical protein [Mediterranea massiliensis]